MAPENPCKETKPDEDPERPPHSPALRLQEPGVVGTGPEGLRSTLSPSPTLQEAEKHGPRTLRARTPPPSGPKTCGHQRANTRMRNGCTRFPPCPTGETEMPLASLPNGQCQDRTRRRGNSQSSREIRRTTPDPTRVTVAVKRRAPKRRNHGAAKKPNAS